MPRKNRLTWGKWVWSDWRTDEALQLCSLAARGLWIEMLCISAESEPYGYVSINGKPPTVGQLAKLVNATPTEVEKHLEELRSHQVFSVTDDGTIYSRRIVHDVAAIGVYTEHGRQGGNPALVFDDPDFYTSVTDDVEAGFRRWWALQPKKHNRAGCRRKYILAIKKKGATIKGIHRSFEDYLETPSVQAGYCMLPQTWLNQYGWETDWKRMADAEPDRTAGKGARAQDDRRRAILESSGLMDSVERDPAGTNGGAAIDQGIDGGEADAGDDERMGGDSGSYIDFDTTA